MSRRQKPFAQYSTLLPDGRPVVSVVAFEPVSIRIWIVANSKSAALRRVREIGVPSPHVDTLFRPGHRLARLAAADPSGMVFSPDVVSPLSVWCDSGH